MIVHSPIHNFSLYPSLAQEKCLFTYRIFNWFHSSFFLAITVSLGICILYAVVWVPLFLICNEIIQIYFWMELWLFWLGTSANCLYVWFVHWKTIMESSSWLSIVDDLTSTDACLLLCVEIIYSRWEIINR